VPTQKANESSRKSPVQDATTRRSPRIAGTVAVVIHGILSTLAVCALPAATNGRRLDVPYAVSCHRTPIGTSSTKRPNVIPRFALRGVLRSKSRFDSILDCAVSAGLPDGRNPEIIHMGEKSPDQSVPCLVTKRSRHLKLYGPARKSQTTLTIEML
jgi:hypothetical protein